MGLWQRCIAWFFSPSRRQETRSPEFPPEPNEADIAEELQLREEAKRLGEAGQPAPDSTIPAGIEAQIVQRIDKARASYLDWAASRLAVVNGDLSRLDVTTVVNHAAQAAEEFARKANALLSERSAVLRELKEEVARCDTALDEFRQQNRLVRSARYPQSAGTFLRIAVLVLLIVVEGGVNSALFATGLEGGLISGFVYAAGLALVNVALAASLGRFFLPNLFHRSRLRKVLGSLGLIAAFVTMTSVSLTIAHYRAALVADIDAPGKIALETLKHTPFGFDDITSWLLFGLSMLFATAALADGVLFDDTYPGYGRHSREADEAHDAYQEEISDVRDELAALKDEALELVDENIKAAQAFLVRQEASLGIKTKTLSRLQSAMLNAQRCHQALITLFRTENVMHRKGTPPPASFSVMPTLVEVEWPNFKLEENRAAFEAQQARVQTLLEKVQTLRAAIQSSFNQEFDTLTALEDHLPPRANSRSLKAVAA
ncbi:hypothetical protein WN982_19860 [Paraburkholderia sp. IMGN_8]|uniref:hypothetical protein n=1 Tax=Paraburkholderia sp. IMGN_8 TaxID=3136564 RepID=UPI00310188C2